VALSPSERTVFVGGRSTDGDVEALAIASSTLYVGGHFTTVGAGDRDHLAALSATVGLQAWDPGANGVFGVFRAAITSGRVASGGEFTQGSGDAHQGVVQLTGAA
jgi:trimeric autotransporter adhesin